MRVLTSLSWELFMKTSNPLVIIGILFLFSSHISLAGEVSIDYESIIKTTIDWSANGVLATEKDAPNCLALDVAALIFDMFLAVGKNVNEEKLQVISNTMYNLNPTIYSSVEELRFHPATALQWHPFADMTVAQFKDVAFEYLKPRLEIDKITAAIKESDNGKIPEFIITTIKSLANKDLFIDMVNFWKTASLGLPTDPTKAEVTCCIQ